MVQEPSSLGHVPSEFYALFASPPDERLGVTRGNFHVETMTPRGLNENPCDLLDLGQQFASMKMFSSSNHVGPTSSVSSGAFRAARSWSKQ